MESNHRETNSTSSVNLDEKEKKSLSMSMLDASIIVLILTGFTYLLGFVFKQGFLGYYGINDLNLDKVEIYYIATSFNYILIFIAGCCMAFVALCLMLFPIRQEGKLYRAALIAFFLAITTFVFLPYFFNKQIKEIIPQTTYWVITVFVFLDWALDKKCTSYRKNATPWKKNIISFIMTVKTKKLPRFICFMFFLIGTLLIFEAKGGTEAAQKEDYLVIYEKKSPLVVIEQNGDNLLVAHVDIKKKIIIPQYKIIESKSTKDEPLVLELKTFKGGLKVKHVNQK
ncbi:hypothetical protein JOD89_005820 [Priestia megaterium]|uniref:hypothetical protein n=1 Tax=Priestia megaterium TaxID=1404 RepID=UPI003D1B6D66